MTVEEITEHIFSLGGKGRSEGPLNEHGFGLKNALCVLTAGNKLPWIIKTRDNEAVSKGIVYTVKGPFSSRLKLELGDLSQWNDGLLNTLLEIMEREFGLKLPLNFLIPYTTAPERLKR